MEWYEFALDNDKTLRTLLKHLPTTPFPTESQLSTLPPAASRAKLDGLRKNLDDMAVVALYATFEAILLEDLSKQCDDEITMSVTPLVEKVKTYAFKEADHWRIKDILDMYKAVVPEQVVGDVKQVCDYRNWVAHGRKADKPTYVRPNTAYRRLTMFLSVTNII